MRWLAAVEGTTACHCLHWLEGHRPPTHPHAGAPDDQAWAAIAARTHKVSWFALWFRRRIAAVSAVAVAVITVPAVDYASAHAADRRWDRFPTAARGCAAGDTLAAVVALTHHGLTSPAGPGSPVATGLGAHRDGRQGAFWTWGSSHDFVPPGSCRTQEPNMRPRARHGTRVLPAAMAAHSPERRKHGGDRGSLGVRWWRIAQTISTAPLARGQVARHVFGHSISCSPTSPAPPGIAHG